jgi:hypothetical protein
LRARQLDALAARQSPGGIDRGPRPTIVGRRIGEGTPLPRRHALGGCHDCRETIWIDEDERDAIETGLEVVLLCRGCARKRFEAGRLEVVPMAFLGGSP